MAGQGSRQIKGGIHMQGRNQPAEIDVAGLIPHQQQGPMSVADQFAADQGNKAIAFCCGEKIGQAVETVAVGQGQLLHSQGSSRGAQLLRRVQSPVGRKG